MAVCASLLAGLMPISLLGEFVSAGTLLAMAMVSGSVLYLRLSRPDVHRPFRAPIWPITCLVAVGGCITFLILMSGTSWIRLMSWMLIGLVVYVLRHLSAARDPAVQAI